MKKIFFIVCIVAMSLVSCSKYDDVALWNKSMDMDSRISDLEALCRQLNGEIQSLQTIVEAVQNNDYVTSVVPVMQDGEEIGYTITFSKSAPVTIYHGKDGQNGKDGAAGKDGYTPKIGIKQDTDGVYYWTLDGEWLTDGSGSKIKAEGRDGQNGTDGKDGKDGANGKDGVDGKDGADGKDGVDGKDGANGKDGTDGKDGITPQLKIEDGYWFISYDNGLSWQKLGKATGEDGKNGTNGENGAAGKDGDSFFKSVDTESSDEYVIFTLSDGTEIKIPTWYAFEQLRTLCNQMNTNINALQTIVDALKENDYVTGVTPLMENGKEVGYTITFSKSKPVTIYHGKDGQNGLNGENGAAGKDGYTPKIGIKQDTDGIYYWTLDGEWLTDDSGNKIKAEGRDGAKGEDGSKGEDGQKGDKGDNGENGTNGKDGITPQLKIEDGYWYVSYNNGESWQKLGKATGEDGKNGTNGENGTAGKDGDSFFKSVDTSNSDYVILTLADGTEIKLPKYSQLDITFDNDVLTIAVNSTKDVAYTIVSSSADVEIEVVTSSDIKAKVVKSSVAAGVLTVTTGSTIDEYSHILVFVSNGEKTIMKRLDIKENFEIPDDMELAFPDPNFRTYVLDNFDTNHDGKISKGEALIVREINIRKLEDTPESEKILTLEGLRYFTNLMYLYCSSNLLTNLDLSSNIALISLSCSNNQLEALDLSYNIVLQYLSCSSNNLTNLDLSNNIKLTNLSCDSNQLIYLTVNKCTELTALDCAYNKLTYLDISGCASLERLSCYSNQLTGLDVSMNTSLSHLSCFSNPLEILDLGNVHISNLSILGLSSSNTFKLIGNNIKTLDVSDNNLQFLDISECLTLETLYCQKNQLTELDVTKNTALNTLWCFNNKLSTLDLSKNPNLISLYCSSNQLTILDISKTNLGNSTSSIVLRCSSNPLTTLYVKSGWIIPKITTEDRNTLYIPSQTEIAYVD